ncbi:MAG TPA: molybdopterin-dependent oxidoreductase [Methyloceanibacter sp.]|nr:molybdopterin-dependent oxidoreductase [Methyloceanibacter sp.]
MRGARDGTLALASAALGSCLGLPRLSFAGEAPVTPGVPVGTASSAVLYALPVKKPLIKLSYRPPNYETPLKYFNDVLTPNDVFFVRYHVGAIPEVDLATWKLSVGGDAVDRSAEYTLDELKNGFEQVEIVAVNQCSGNRRGLAQPHVQGIQWGYGAMGNARWRGVRLKDVLDKSGVKKDAVEVGFDGADHGIVDKTPDFIKSLPMWRALDENTLLAWDMNGAPLPHWNGFPLRLVVPGWTGTYWVKLLTSIDVRSQPFGGFWMSSAYRLPKGKFALVDGFASQATEANTPITELVVNSLITNLVDGTKVAAGQPLEVKGIAWDAGYGIETVIVSVDGGQNWRPAALGEDLGRFSFRPWSSEFVLVPGPHVVMAKATNPAGAKSTARADPQSRRLSS